MINKILVPLDGSKLAEKALPYAEELAEKFKAELILVQVLFPALVTAAYDTYASFPTMETLPPHRDEVETYMKGVQGELRELYFTSKVVIMESQPVAEAIVDMASAEGVDLIVMSTHGRSGLGRWVYGSVATKVLQQAPCPVYLVRAKEYEN